MKKAYHYTSWRLNGEEFCGVNFGYDFCAEHEIGITGIREAFGIKVYSGSEIVKSIKKIFGVLKPDFGINARLITQKPPTLHFNQKGHFCVIYYSSFKLSDEYFSEGIKSLSWEMSKPNGKDLVTFWGDNGFMLVTTNEEYYQKLKKGFFDMNIAIFTAGRNGLVICLPDKLDDVTKTEMYASDLNAWELRKMSEESGIEKELAKAKKEYLVLKPGWKNPAKKEMWFFLNPVDQRRYNHGWYTVEELRQWIADKGPIVKDGVENKSKEEIEKELQERLKQQFGNGNNNRTTKRRRGKN